MFLTKNISYNQTQATIAVTYWVIAGGGGAGRDDFFGTRMGGGGAGGILTSTVNIPVNETLTATSIGAGGSYQSSSSTSGNVGNNSVLTSTFVKGEAVIQLVAPAPPPPKLGLPT